MNVTPNKGCAYTTYSKMQIVCRVHRFAVQSSAHNNRQQFSIKTWNFKNVRLALNADVFLKQ